MNSDTRITASAYTVVVNTRCGMPSGEWLTEPHGVEVGGCNGIPDRRRRYARTGSRKGILAAGGSHYSRATLAHLGVHHGFRYVMRGANIRVHSNAGITRERLISRLR